MQLRVSPSQGSRALARVEVISIVTLLVGIVIVITSIFPIPRMADRSNSTRTKCLHNLKNIGLAVRLYAEENNDLLPFAGAFQNPSRLPKLSAGDYVRAISNQLGTVKPLICPADDRNVASSWQSLGDSNISYLINLVAHRTNAFPFLTSDRGLVVNGRVLTAGVSEVNREQAFDWSAETHQGIGHVAGLDGSAQAVRSRALTERLFWPGVRRTVLLVP